MITVTGATGPTGRNLIEGLVAAGLPLRALVHNEQAVRRLPAGVAETVVGDMLVPADTERAVAGSDAIVHIGPALHPREIAMGATVIDAATTVAEGVFRQPFSLDMPMSFVDLADVGEVAALVLSDPQRALERRLARVVSHLLPPTNDAAPACLPAAA